MASGSSKGFDFASDDILCSYEDYTNQETSNGSHSDSAIATNSAKVYNFMYLFVIPIRVFEESHDLSCVYVIFKFYYVFHDLGLC